MEGLFASISLSPIASVVTDARSPDNPIVAVNRAFCELTGYREDEALGRNCRFLAGPETEPDARETLRHAVDRAAVRCWWSSPIIARTAALSSTRS